MGFVNEYMQEVGRVASQVDGASTEKMVRILQQTRANHGRVFILGVGGSAANASHAVNDFRKLCGMEAYAPTDNASELTARTNDIGWDSVFADWLKGSRLGEQDCVFVLSVGGGSLEKHISVNLVNALQLAKSVKSKIIGIVGRDGGYTATVADACCVIPTVNPAHVTPHTEAFQAVVWHAMVSHPELKTAATTW